MNERHKIQRRGKSILAQLATPPDAAELKPSGRTFTGAVLDEVSNWPANRVVRVENDSVAVDFSSAPVPVVTEAEARSAIAVTEQGLGHVESPIHGLHETHELSRVFPLSLIAETVARQYGSPVTALAVYRGTRTRKTSIAHPFY